MQLINGEINEWELI